MKAVQVHQFGNSDVLALEEIAPPRPQAGEVLIELRGAGVNRADILLRSGNYHAAPPFPFVPGFEGSGIVTDAGPGVTGIAAGDRVLATAGRPGFYAEYVAAPAAKVVRIPEAVSAVDAAALPTAWVTAWYCLTELARLKRGETILVRGAASGVGDAAVQLARHLGATVIAAAGSDEKVAWARANGASEGINYERQDVAAEVARITGQQGVAVVLDLVGGKDFAQSLKSAGHFGRVVALANVSLEGGMVNTRDFYPRNVTIYGFQLGNLVARGGYDLRPHLEQLLELVRDRNVQVHVDRTFPLSEASAAHRYLEDRRNRGKVILVPSSAPSP
jgi:NADPH2:quinone reductase